VLIVEDHALVADSLAAALAEAGLEVRAVIPRHRDDLTPALDWGPDVVLLDLKLGAFGSGLDLLALLGGPGRAVIVMTGETDPWVLGRCLEAGAAAVMDKGQPLGEVLDALERVGDGRPAMNPLVRAELVGWYRRRNHEVNQLLAPFGQLTPREQQVLAQLMDGQPAEAIARASYLSISTVRSQIKSILAKLGVTSQLAAVARARQAGWRLPAR